MILVYYVNRGTSQPHKEGRECYSSGLCKDCNPSASKYTYLNEYKLSIKIVETEFEINRGRTLQSFSDTRARE